MLTLSVIAGVVLFIVLSRKRKNRPRGPSRTQCTKTTRTVYTISARSQSGPDPEKLKQQQQRDAARRQKEQFNRIQAEKDMIHYTQVKKDLLKAYDAAGVMGSDTEKNIRKRIAYDNAIRRTEKQIEKAAYNAQRTGWNNTGPLFYFVDLERKKQLFQVLFYCIRTEKQLFKL